MTTTELPDLIEVNRFLAEVAAERREALWRAIRDRDATGAPIPGKVSDRWEEANAVLYKSVVALAMNSPRGTVVHTADGPMTVVTISDISAALQHNEPIEVTLTQDGGIALRVWDESVGMCEHVRYEVYTAAGRVRHGFIAQDSRKIVQTG